MHRCEDAIRDFSANKLEMTMRKKILTVLVVPLIAALTAQAAAASEHHHTRTKGHAVARAIAEQQCLCRSR
jgi:hypothetical protein